MIPIVIVMKIVHTQFICHLTVTGSMPIKRILEKNIKRQGN